LKLFRWLIMLGLVLPACAQYAGPAILSRGEAPAAMAAPKIDFSFSVALTGSYSNGLSGVTAPNAQGQLPSIAVYGESLTLGISGAHSWRHTHLGLNYSGGFTHYNQNGYFGGLSQGLSLGLSHQFARHVSFSVRESAGLFTQFVPGTVALNSSVPFDPSQSTIPTTDFYDNRTIFTSTQANLTFQASSRLSFSMGGGDFLTRYQSSALYGMTGESASGDVQYRLSRQTTVGAAYSFTHYGYTNSVGGAFVHSASLTFSDRISRWTELSFYGGASRVESTFQETVPIDPAILAILCPSYLTAACPVSTTTYNNHQLEWGPNLGVRFSRSFQRGVFYLGAGEGITPGNGLFLTSRVASASAGYGYSGLRKWSLNVGVTYSTALSLGNVLGGYGQVTGTYSMSRLLVKSISFVSSFSATQYQSNSFTGYNRLIYSASMGLGYSSRNIPVRFF
jgi:hypothetical protein